MEMENNILDSNQTVEFLELINQVLNYSMYTGSE